MTVEAAGINRVRGLDIFQFVPRDALALAAGLQQNRRVQAFGVTHIRELAAT
jgi:hypothetical protein